MKRIAMGMALLVLLLFSVPALTANQACELTAVQRLEAKVPLSIVRVHDARDGMGFLVGDRSLLTSWSLLEMRRGPEVVLANGSRYRADVVDVQGDIALLELGELLENPTRPEVIPIPLPLGQDFLDTPPHLLAYYVNGAVLLEYRRPEKDESKNHAYALDNPDPGMPILTCDGAVVGMVQSIWGDELGPNRRERSTIVAMVRGRPVREEPGDLRLGFAYDGLTGLVDERGIGGVGISLGPRWTYADQLQVDLRADAFLLFNSHHIGGRFQGGLAAGPRLRLAEGLYLVPQIGGEVSVTTTTLLENSAERPCSESARCVEVHKRLEAIEGEAAFVPFGRVAVESGLAEGLIGGAVFYSLHLDRRDDSRTHQFGIGMHF